MAHHPIAMAAAFALAFSGSVPGLAQESPSATTAGATAANAQTQSNQFRRAIRKLYDLKERAWAAGDAQTIVTKFYAPDAMSAGEGDRETMVGRDAFLKAYRQYVKDVPTVRIESVKTYVNGNAGWDWANFYSEPKPDKKSMYPPSPIRIVFLFAKEHGQWICKGDIFVNGKLPTMPR